MKCKKILSFVIILILLAVLFVVAVNSGSVKVSYGELLKGIFIEHNDNVNIILDLRFPRILIAMLSGAALAVSGVLFQAVLKNPLADPGIIGISSGAGFVSAIIIAFFPTLFLFTPIFSFLGGMVASGFGSMSSQNYQSASELINANISMKTWNDVKLLGVYVVIGLVLAFVISGKCNLLALEDKTVRGLGVNVNGLRVVISIVAVLLASITTAVAGAISFVGLIVPHMGRLLVGSEHKLLVPFSALLGAFVMLLADTVGRLIAYPYEISPAIIMSVVGGPFFIFLLKRSDKTYGN